MTADDEQAPGYPAHWEADVLLRDGGTARIRPIVPADADRLVAFYQRVSDQSKYFRFFAPYPRLSDRDVRRFTHHDFVHRVGMAALVRDEFIATVRFDRIDDTGRPSESGSEAEIAFLVQDDQQGRGVASALMEHAAAVAGERGIRRFIAEVLPENRKMAKVFTDAGYTQRRSFADGVLHFELDLEPTEQSLAVMRSREHRAEARSMQRLLAPASVAVVGAGRRTGSVGRTLLRNLLAAGFTGDLYAVNRHPDLAGGELDGVPVHPSVSAVPGPVELAVIAVPAEHVPAVVADCGAHGVRALVVITAGYAEAGPGGRERQRALVRQARAAGMRVLGPNSFGLFNTDPAVRLNASLSPRLPLRGPLGIFSQSGEIGAALLEAADRRGLGVSAFVSAGNRADVSGNDALQYFEEDPDTRAALLYLESFGNPRKFSRLARRVSAAKPLLVVKGGRHQRSIPPGHLQALTGISDTTVDALFQQTGVVRADTITELYDTADLMAYQPLPRGDRVAIVGNSDSLALLTHDAALGAGLRPLPPHDLGTAATPDDFRAGLAAAVARPDSDAVVAVVIPPIGRGDYPLFPGSSLIAPDAAEALHSAADPATAAFDTAPYAAAVRDTARRAAAAGKPLLVVHLALPQLIAQINAPVTEAPVTEAPVTEAPVTEAQASNAPATEAPASAAAAPAAETTAPAEGPQRVPGYPRPERAIGSLAHAVRYTAWRERAAAHAGVMPEFPDIAVQPARRMVAAALADAHERELDEQAAAELLGCFGIRLLRTLPASDEDAAARAAGTLGYPVALKATTPRLRHRPDLGAVRLDLPGEAELRRAHREMTEALGTDAGLVVQPMAARGVDTAVSATVDPDVGAILAFGLAGAASELLGDVAHRLIPATDQDVASLVREIRAAPLLFGWRGAAQVDTGALEELLLRISQLVDDIPEVASLSLEPVAVARHGVSVLGARIRLARLPARTDLGPRTLGRP